MKIKVGDYVKHKEGEDWERVNSLYDGHGGKYLYTDDNNIKPLIAKSVRMENITEVLPYGEEIMVSDDNKKWNKGIFIAYDKIFKAPFRCIFAFSEDEFRNNDFIDTTSWNYAKPIS